MLDAIDFCLGARRNIQFSDADFHLLDISKPITISVTVGELHNEMKSLDNYGLYLRGYEPLLPEIEDEPRLGLETVITVNLTVSSDLEPVWSLVSERAKATGQSRNLTWSDRTKLAPTRLGAYADNNLGWRRGSVLNLISDERADASSALVKAARDARAEFSRQAGEQLATTLATVEQAAKYLGIPFGTRLQAMLDTHSISFNGGTVSLHDEQGVPLRGLGIGSARLLIAGLQRTASQESTIALVDEIEHGLEPHRIIRLLGSLGAKEPDPPLQVFVTTHSATVIRELNVDQLAIVRSENGNHVVRRVPNQDDFQSTVRLYPEALVAPKVVICEGASEVGFLRGLDEYRCAFGMASLASLGVAIVDGKGADQLYRRVNVFKQMGYQTAVVRDDDVQPTPDLEQEFLQGGGKLSKWRSGRALEDELFLSLSDVAITALIAFAVEMHGEDIVDAHIVTASSGTSQLIHCQGVFSPELRAILGRASRTKKAGWYKTVSWMEYVARWIVGPDLTMCDPAFKAILFDLYSWMENG